MVNHAIDPPNAGSRTPGATAVADDLRSLHRWAALLSESAQGMRVAAGTPACAAAIAQSLGCVEAALSDLEQAVAEMEAVAGDHLYRASVLLGGRWNDVTVARTAHEFQELGRALANARRACGTVRRGAGPVLAELTAM